MRIVYKREQTTSCRLDTMTARSARNESRSNAMPLWGWSGAEKRATLPLSDEALARLYKSLRSPRSTVAELRAKILELGARYHRYLHQDEFGPTRAERMSALRAVLAQIAKLDSLILDLPEHLAHDLVNNFENQPLLQSWTIGQVHHAASIELCSRRFQRPTNDLSILENFCAAAEVAIDLISSLDASSEAELLNDAFSTGVLIERNVFSAIDAPISALKAQVGLTLDRLGRQHGPEKQLSIWWLVWELCDLWTQETALPVTNSAVRNGDYTGSPGSPAGKFVLAVVEALQPSESWMGQHLRVDAAVRARKVAAPPANQARTVYFAMRKYVADHTAPGRRRGRPRGTQ
jgi:hypothetical protein